MRLISELILHLNWVEPEADYATNDEYYGHIKLENNCKLGSITVTNTLLFQFYSTSCHKLIIKS